MAQYTYNLWVNVFVHIGDLTTGTQNNLWRSEAAGVVCGGCEVEATVGAP